MGVWIETFSVNIILKYYIVTPYVGVWIETAITVTRPGNAPSLLMWECGLKHLYRHLIQPLTCHSLCGSVDWNTYCVFVSLWCWSHSLCGSVDWNKSVELIKKSIIVTPYVGVWIETCYESVHSKHHRVTPYVGVWIETTLKTVWLGQTMSHSLCGSVDWNFSLWW